jgi:hypothetical protein
MAVLGSPSCDSGSYTTPNVKGLLDKRKKSFSQRFTKNQEEPLLTRLGYEVSFTRDLYRLKVFLMKRWLFWKTNGK